MRLFKSRDSKTGLRFLSDIALNARNQVRPGGCGRLDGIKMRLLARRGRGFQPPQFQMSQDTREQVVEIVRHPHGHPTQGFHAVPLRLALGPGCRFRQYLAPERNGSDASIFGVWYRDEMHQYRRGYVTFARWDHEQRMCYQGPAQRFFQIARRQFLVTSRKPRPQYASTAKEMSPGRITRQRSTVGIHCCNQQIGLQGGRGFHGVLTYGVSGEAGVGLRVLCQYRGNRTGTAEVSWTKPYFTMSAGI